jgi:hypothetical protein
MDWARTNKEISAAFFRRENANTFRQFEQRAGKCARALFGLFSLIL